MDPFSPYLEYAHLILTYQPLTKRQNVRWIQGEFSVQRTESLFAAESKWKLCKIWGAVLEHKCTNNTMDVNCIHVGFPPRKQLWPFLFPSQKQILCRHQSRCPHNNAEMKNQQAEIHWLEWINQLGDAMYHESTAWSWFLFLHDGFLCKRVDEKSRWSRWDENSCENMEPSRLAVGREPPACGLLDQSHRHYWSKACQTTGLDIMVYLLRPTLLQGNCYHSQGWRLKSWDSLSSWT